MRAADRFTGKRLSFWANVRLVGDVKNYKVRGEDAVKTYSLGDIVDTLQSKGLGTDPVIRDGDPTPMGRELVAYLKHRADVINTDIEPLLMDADRAEAVFEELVDEHDPDCPIPMNKQTGEKALPNYLTAIVNIIAEAYSEEMPVNYGPRELTKVTRNGRLVGTPSRRMDGACPGVVSPIAVWETKEHYHTTTFGSRVSAAIYESLLDGLELHQIEDQAGVEVDHLLMVDAHRTWWEDGKPYLCRIIDALHMGYIDEVLFGYEVVERLPELVQEWLERYRT